MEVTNNMVNEINDIRTEESQYRREMDAEERRGEEKGDLHRLISNVLRQYGKGKSIDEIANWEDVDCEEVDKILKISQTLNTQDPKEILLQLKHK